MKRFVNVWTFLAVMVCGVALLGGCQAEGVGDPCTPENIPSNGFVFNEAYIETSSVQCRSRICLVNGLMGDPSCVKEECEPSDLTCMNRCASREQIDNSVYCTCRCAGPEGTARFCECPDGFECSPVITSESAGAGIQGSYCVRKTDG